MTDTAKASPTLYVISKSPDKRLRILLVDRHDASSQALQHAFESSRSATFVCTDDPEEAKAIVATEQYDLVAVDPAIEGGFALLKHIKDTYRWIATLVATDDHGPTVMRRSVKCQIDGLVFKPAKPAEFMEEALLLANAISARRERQQKRVLAIGAHPDDVEIGCGGALAKHRANGDLVQVLTLSQGAAGGDVNVRAVEARNAARLLGVKLKLGNLRDTYIGDGPETIAMIESVVREMKPTHVYTHCAEDTHQDHTAVHRATLIAARSVPNIFAYQSPSSTPDFRPNGFVDITDFIKRKLDAIDAYKSQTDRMDALEHDVLLSTARYWGRYAGYIMAEPLVLIRARDTGLEKPLKPEQPGTT